MDVKTLKSYVPYAKNTFIRSLPSGASLLDVGCGNHAPTRAKRLNPALDYHGIDIVPFFLDESDYEAADELRFVEPDEFVAGLRSWGSSRFDAVLASHVLEHVNDRPGTIRAIAEVVKPGGTVYYAFPSRRSVRFPSRAGTLNFYDDPNHRDLPPDVDLVLKLSCEAGLRPREVHDPYRPLVHRVAGLLQEPVSRRRRTVMSGTWALWGFESVLVFSR